jgi:hypothetical protein
MRLDMCSKVNTKLGYGIEHEAAVPFDNSLVEDGSWSRDVSDLLADILQLQPCLGRAGVQTRCCHSVGSNLSLRKIQGHPCISGDAVENNRVDVLLRIRMDPAAQRPQYLSFCPLSATCVFNARRLASARRDIPLPALVIERRTFRANRTALQYMNAQEHISMESSLKRKASDDHSSGDKRAKVSCSHP